MLFPQDANAAGAFLEATFDYRPAASLTNRVGLKGEWMRKGYVIFTMLIHDQAGFEAYVQKALPTLIQSGGRPIIVDDNPEVIEGRWHGTRTAVLEFDSLDIARAWYESPGYQAIVGERHNAAQTNAVIVGGFVMPGS